MSQQKHQPVPVDTDEITFRSCATELFRWVRKGAELIEEAPAYVQELGEDLARAWEDSGKS
jgi:hypothetical protein